MAQQVAEDVAGQLSDLIAKGRVFGSSDNIRVGRFKFLVLRVFADKVDSGRFAFAEFKVLESAPNPQLLPYGDKTSKAFDDGTKPNLVGSRCALKVNFDGPGAKSAPGNVKAFILGLLGFNPGDVTDADVDNTWRDLARQKPVRKGELVGVDGNSQPVYADKDKQANPACGMVVYCTGSMKEKSKTKKLGADKINSEAREYITACSWEPALADNAAEQVAKRRAEIESAMVDDDEEDAAAAAPRAPGAPPSPQAAAPVPPGPPVPQQAAPTPPAPPPLPAGWVLHTDPKWAAQGFYYKPGVDKCFTEAQLRAGAAAGL